MSIESLGASPPIPQVVGPEGPAKEALRAAIVAHRTEHAQQAQELREGLVPDEGQVTATRGNAINTSA